MTIETQIPGCVIYQENCRKEACPFWRLHTVRIDKDKRLYETFERCILITMIENKIKNDNPDVMLANDDRFKVNRKFRE